MLLLMENNLLLVLMFKEKILSEIQFIYDVNYIRKIIYSDFFNQSGCFENYI